MNFATLQGLTIPEGVVTEIKDASGRVLWSLEKPIPAVLQVAKITSDTYAGSTTYTGESFILLDIYPKTSSSTVTITYGGLTKTLTFSGTNAQQVFFGTFNGVSDSVTTPNNGTLTIDGGYSAFGVGSYSSDSKTTKYCSCITNVNEWGQIKKIPNRAFSNCTSLTITQLPKGITSIGSYAFYYCEKINITEIPNGVTSIDTYAFYMDYKSEDMYDNERYPKSNMSKILLPATLKSIGAGAFVYSAKHKGGSGDAHDDPIVSQVTLLATTPPTISDTTFGGCDEGEYNLSITVPKGCADVYKTANIWSEYASFITEVS